MIRGIRKEFNDNSQILCFEKIIKNVLNTVRLQERRMNRFYEKSYRGILGFTTTEDFQESIYSFKNIGQEENFDLRQKGHTHIFRIISSHLDYIDKYRLELVNSDVLSNDEKVEVNRKLVQFLYDYLMILASSYDNTSYTNDFILVLLKKIDDIKASKYNDFSIKVRYRF